MTKKIDDCSGKKKTSRRKNRVTAGTMWLRSWRAKVRNRKVFQLSDAQYRFWDMALCLTNEAGVLPSVDDIAFDLRMSRRDVECRLAELIELGFFDPIMSLRGAPDYRAHNWDKWQAVVDQSKHRMRRLRAGRRDAGDANETAGDGFGDGDVTVIASVSVSGSEGTTNSEFVVGSVSDPAKMEVEVVGVDVCAGRAR